MLFSLDIATASILIGLVSLAMAVVFRGGPEGGFVSTPGGHWAIATLLTGIASLLPILRGTLPLQVEAVTAHMLAVIGLALLHRGTAIFVGARPADVWYVTATVGTLIGISYFIYFKPSVDGRLAVIYIVRAAFYVGALKLLLRRGLPRGAHYLVVLLGVASVWSVFRAGLAVATGGPLTDYLKAGTAHAAPTLLSGVLAVLIVAYQFRLESERTRDELTAHARQLEQHHQQLQATVADRTAELTRIATTDSLTGLANRRHFMEQAKLEVERARRHGRPLAALMLDIDHFKRINDTLGHPIGDQVIVAVAEACRAGRRATDVLGRIGGEEFALLLPEVGADAALQAAERLRRAIAALQIEGAPGLSVTASVGVAALNQMDSGIEALLSRADRALYHAKEAGRNRVEAGTA